MEPKHLARLFTDRERTDPTPKGHDEPSYAFLDRVDRPWFGALRDTLEGWHAELPTGLAVRVEQQFRSRREREHIAAFLELLGYVVFKRLDYDPEPNPPIPGSPNVADLLLSGARERLMVESTVSFTDDTDEPSARRQAAAYAALDRLESPNFFLGIEVEQGEGATPSMDRVRRELTDWLASLDPDSVLATNHIPTREIVAGSWRLTFDAIPKSPGARGKPGVRPLGIFAGPFRIIRAHEHIRESLKAKAAQMKDVAEPLLLIVDAYGTMIDEDHFEVALLGDIGIHLPFGSVDPGPPIPIRQLTGLWTERRPGRRGHVSAVMTFRNTAPWLLHRVEPTVWVNPWADRPSRLVASLPFHRVEHDRNGKRREIPRQRSIAEVLGLPEDWPRPGDPWGD